MSFSQLLCRNLFYHWRGNLAVFLGVVLGAAVLTGALLVGDSLRGSLRALTLEQLGWVEEAMVPGRFFRAALAGEIAGASDRHAAALLLQGSAARRGPDGKALDPVGRVTVLGVDASFWPEANVPEGTEFWSSSGREVVLNRTLADALGAAVGETIKIRVQRPDSAPGEHLMGNRRADRVVEELDLKVRAVLANEGMARFSLKPTPEPVRNAFVPIGLLHRQPDLRLAGKANAIFLAGPPRDLHAKLTLEDWGLRYLSPTDRAEALVRLLDENNTDGKLKRIRWRGRVPDDLAALADADGILTADQVIAFYEDRHDYSVLESTRMLLEPGVVRAVEKVAPKDEHPRWQWKPTLIYLADRLGTAEHSISYAIVAGDDEWVPDDERILLVDWPGTPLKVQSSDRIKITYFAPDARNHLESREATFPLLQFPLPMLEGVYDDPDLTPIFPGVTDKLNIGDWLNPPFPFDKNRAKGPPDEFWKRYRTTPQAYISLKKAKELWNTRFGDVTSIQVRTPGLEPREPFAAALLLQLQPEQGGFVFQRVKAQALSASSGATDFGVLFLAFSVFLIVAALLLVGLLVRLNLERRGGELGVLLATGWDHDRVRRLILAEGALLAHAGVAVGIGVALVYTHLMLKLLAANWPGGDSLNFLRLHWEPLSFAIGIIASLVVSLLTLLWATRHMVRMSPRALLLGETTETLGLADSKPGWSRWLIPLGVLGALGLAAAAAYLPSHDAQVGCFFGSGALLLIACLAGVWQALKRSARAASPQPSLWRLGVRNAGRHAVRSALTVGLLASASFVIVAVESFHKDTDQSFHLKSGGSGGFAFYAEGNVPVFEDLNNKEVRRDHGLDTPELRGAEFFPCRLQAGDDASCLSLYKPLRPRVMGVPRALSERGGFHFAAAAESADSDAANPWRLLETPGSDAIPAIIDANTAQWILKVELGDTIDVNDEEGRTVKLRVVALLQESIFQSEVLISEANFLKLFPRQAGFSFFLIDVGAADPARLTAVEQQLTRGLEPFNLDVQTTASRLQGYLAVENMYLATFQALGGLGLVLGAAGLAIVLLRGVWERRAELALLLALGFRPGQLALLVLVENAYLLGLGLAAGTASALVAVAPHLIGAGAQVLWLRIAALLAAVLGVGLTAAALAVWSSLKTPVLTALRRE